MRKTELIEGFCLTGTIRGAVKPDMVSEITLPYMLQSAQALCGQEGLFLREWDIYSCLERPEEPAHSHAERTLLTLDGVYGKGTVHIGEHICEPVAPHMVLDVTEAMRSGHTQLHIHFPAQHPVLLDGERGCELNAVGGLISAELRNIYHMRFADLDIDAYGNVHMDLYAYAAGKYRLCMRLMKDDKLLWAENSTIQLVVGMQRIDRVIAAEHLVCGAVLKAAVDMGGEGCDVCEAVYSSAGEKPEYPAHFRAFPTDKMLKQVQLAGFDGVVFYEYPHSGLQKLCRSLGLHVRWEREPIKLDPVLVCGTEQEISGKGCLTAIAEKENDMDRFRQANAMFEAALALRAKGMECRVLAWSRQSDAQDGLFDVAGDPRPVLYALKNALGKVTVSATGTSHLYHPYEEFEEEITLFAASPDEKPAAVQVQLYSWCGKEIATRVFPVCIKEPVQILGNLRARLPWNDLRGLMLRMQCIRDGRILAVNHAYYACADEQGNKIPFPRADLTECMPGEICNVSDAIAMGVTILCEDKIMLCHGAMLPQERIMLATNGSVVVKYGNLVTKGGKKCVEQRLLRGVFAN